MIPRYRFFEEAIKAFLLEIPEGRESGSKEITRRYEVAGSICVISKTYGPRHCFPRARWLEPVPDKYIGVDLKTTIRAFLSPYALPNMKEEEEPVSSPEKPLAFECGVAVHQTDYGHYKNLLRKLQTKELFTEEDKEQSDG